MTRKELICAVKEALEAKGVTAKKHFYQGGRAVQVTTCDGCFNIVAVQVNVKKDSNG